MALVVFSMQAKLQFANRCVERKPGWILGICGAVLRHASSASQSLHHCFDCLVFELKRFNGSFLGPAEIKINPTSNSKLPSKNEFASAAHIASNLVEIPSLTSREPSPSHLD